MPPEDIKVELTDNDDKSVDSNVSFDGVPDKALHFVIDEDIMNDIALRRQKRYITKMRARLEADAINSIV